jgi:hypothetical protein
MSTVFIGYSFHIQSHYDNALQYLNDRLPEYHVKMDSQPIEMKNGKKGLIWPKDADTNTYISILTVEYGQPKEFVTDVDFYHP